MERQIIIGDGIQADHIEADSLFLCLDDVIQHLIRKIGIIAKISIRSPILIPSCMEKQKLRPVRQGLLFPDEIHGDTLSIFQRRTINDQTGSNKLLNRKLIERRPPGVEMGRRIHVGSGVGEHGNHRLLKAILFIGTARKKLRSQGSRIDRHILGNKMC